MLRRSLFALPAAACAWQQGTQEHPAFSLCDNFATDLMGVPDGRPDTWGSAGEYTHVVQILHVPHRMRVRVERIVGDFVMWPTMKGSFPAVVPPGQYIGGLAAIHRFPRDEDGSQRMSDGKGWFDHFVYVQTGTDGPVARAPFDIDLSGVANNLLGETHEIAFKQAVWLNDTGLAAHMELTISNLILRMVRV